MAWASKADARDPDVWPDAIGMTDASLDRYLTAAFEALEGYAPALAPGDPTPAAYVLANVLHARELRNAAARGEADVIGVGDYAIRARPLTAAVKSLLRPHTVSWSVG